MEKLILTIEKKLDLILTNQRTIVDRIGRLEKNISDVKYEVGSVRNDLKSEIRSIKSDISSINRSLDKFL